MEVFNVVLTPKDIFIKDYRTNKVVEQSLDSIPPSVLYSVQHYIESATILKSPFKPVYTARRITTESGTALDRWVKRKS